MILRMYPIVKPRMIELMPILLCKKSNAISAKNCVIPFTIKGAVKYFIVVKTVVR